MDEKYRLKLEKLGLPLDFIDKIPGGYHLCEDRFDEGFPFVYVSDRFLEILGWTREEIAEKFNDNFKALVHPSDWPKCRSNASDCVYRLLGKNGYCWVSGTAKGIVVDGKAYVQGNIADVNCFVENAEKVNASLQEASKAKTNFLFNMSHDIRTPMNAIIGFTELLKKHLDNKETAQRYVDKIESSSEFLLSLINNVLEMARIESGNEHLDESICEVHDFQKSLFSIFEVLVKEKRITFTKSVEIIHGNVWADVTKVREILLNIVSNAVKYTPEGGKITFSLSEVPSERPDYATFKIVVEDSGIGMSKDYLPRLFDDFSRERSSTTSGVIGTGLGMPIVKKLVDLMDGSIEVESELGVGSKFTIVLPFRLADFSDTDFDLDDTLQINPDIFKGKRILLAEDNDLNAEIALSVLEEEGFLVDRATDGIICVSMLEQAPEDYYDMILMDVQMPSMDGYKATQIIRKLPDAKKANIPIVAMTANAFEEDRKDAFRMGMNAHLSKPIQVDKLTKTIGLIIAQAAYGENAYKHWREMFVECEPFVEFENGYKAKGRPCGCLVYEAFGDEIILYADEILVQIFGCDSFEDFKNYVKGSFKSIVYKEDVERVETEISEQIKESSNSIDRVKYRIVRKDGVIRQIDDIGRKLYIENGKAVFFVLIADLGE